ncbi:ABC transporter substrate-binding protein [Pseudonocardia nigra]|uniref:ABC transporter substrate-binding protein n=1 Tax=Pseudonocardia nigra TaxID=1921578 RepID=UPI001C5DCD4F|nr:ABC transporter substrate-binding protein [Pseudonocardia nigra]
MTARRSVRALVLAAVVLLTVACGGGGGGTSGGTEVLTVGIGSEPENLDPHATRAGTDAYFTSNVFETLLERDVEGKQQPALATDYTISEDGTIITFTLRQGVTFHNGEAMTADDVKYSFERFVDPELGNTFAYLLDQLDRVDVIDDYTVAVHLKQFDGSFIPGGGFAAIVPKDYIEQNGDEYFAQNPVGTGALRFVERRIRDSFTLERFDGYWGEQKAAYQRYEFRILSDANSRVAAIRSGAVDVISQVPPQNLAQLEADEQLTVVSGYTGENVWVKFGRLDGDVPWADPTVRQALDFAIDKQRIIDQVLGGLGVPYAGVAPLSSGFDRVDYRQRPFDPERTRTLLAEAGYPDGFDIEIVTPANGRLPASEQVMQAVAGYWNDVGVRAAVRVVEYSQWIEHIRATPPPIQAALGLHGDQTTYDPQFRLITQLACDAPYSHVCDPQLQAMIEEISSTVDEEAREQAYVEAFRYIHDIALEIPLYSSEQAFALRSGVCWTPIYGSPFTDMSHAKPC